MVINSYCGVRAGILLLMHIFLLLMHSSVKISCTCLGIVHGLHSVYPIVWPVSVTYVLLCKGHFGGRGAAMLIFVETVLSQMLEGVQKSVIGC